MMMMISRFCQGMPPIAVRIKAPPPLMTGTLTSFDFHHGASRLRGITKTGISSATGTTLTSGPAATQA
nr:hypothetical protein FA04_17900 [Ensifer adhaerens]